MIRSRLSSLLAVALAFVARDAHAFCGFFVGGADATLYNNASQVVMVHDDDKTVITMVNNYKGEPRAFALVVPVPVVLEKGLVRVIDNAVVTHLDQFTAPRLVEYFDPDPCDVERERRLYEMSAASSGSVKEDKGASQEKSYGVKVEAEYTVGEYDIVILSAKESDGLEAWLRDNKYNIPRGASAALAPYIRSGMKFFVAKVNLAEQKKAGFSTLRPLQFAFSDKRFMLPIRLGMLNADGPQELIVYAISREHRIEITNYRNPKLPSDVEIPTFVKDDFQRFYKDVFTRALDKETKRAVFTEHAWNMSWCDPCSSEPLSAVELEQLGVWWLNGTSQAFVTRLHARYTPETFPEDLMLKVTKDATNFQARYIMRHPWPGSGDRWCGAAESYLRELLPRRDKEVSTLASLTGWSPKTIREKMEPLPEYARKHGRDAGWKDRMKKLFHGGGL
jgi:hypothetical protein